MSTLADWLDRADAREISDALDEASEALGMAANDCRGAEAVGAYAMDAIKALSRVVDLVGMQPTWCPTCGKRGGAR